MKYNKFKTNSDSESIFFYPFWSPTLKPGNFSLHVEQTAGDENYLNDTTFKVVGSGIDLDKNIVKIFPNEAIKENNILPFVSINNKSLPWERTSALEGSPWLALLTFREGEQVKEFRNSKFADFIAKTDNIKNLSLREEKDFEDYLDASYFYIEISLDLFTKIAPAPNDLQWLAHVREEPPFIAQSEQYLQQLKAISNVEESPKYAYLSGNRLAGKGTNVVYLVSVQNYERKEMPGIETIRLLVFKKWSFAYQENENGENFADYLKGIIDKDENLLRLKYDGKDTPVKKAISEGFVPIRHRIRNGDETLSFYRSPLIPFANKEQTTQEIKGADSAIRYNKDLAMFDETYAAAFQAGRLLAMQNKTIAQKIYFQREEIMQALFLDEHFIEKAKLLSLSGEDNNSLSIQEKAIVSLKQLLETDNK